MGVIEVHSTLPGGLTPICNECGIALCWDISKCDYYSRQEFWDNWECKECKEFKNDIQSS